MGIGVCCVRQADQYWSGDDGYRGRVVYDRLINIGQMMIGIGVCCVRQADQYWSDDDRYRGVRAVQWCVVGGSHVVPSPSASHRHRHRLRLLLHRHGTRLRRR